MRGFGFGFAFKLGSGALGPNIVTNGTFDANITGWTAAAPSTNSWQAGRLRVVNGGSGAGTEKVSYASVSTEAGKRYRIDVTVAALNVAQGFINLDTSGVGAAGSGSLLSSGNLNVGTFVRFFTATGATTLVALGVSGSTLGTWAEYDDVSIRRRYG